MKRNALILAAALGFAALTGCETPPKAAVPNPAQKVTLSSSASITQSPNATEKPNREAEKKPDATAAPTKRGTDNPLPEKEPAVSEASSVPPEEPAVQTETAKAPQNEPTDADRPSTPAGKSQDAERTPISPSRMVSAEKPEVTPTPKPTAIPTAEPTAVPASEPTPEPVPSGPYDYPFNVSAICSDLIGVGQGMGLMHVTSMDGEALTPSNTSWSMPVTASQSFQGAALESSLKDYVRSMPGLIASYGGTPLQYFSIYAEPLGNGSYNFYFLY